LFLRYSEILVENHKPTHLYLWPQMGVTPFQFCQDFWHQKTSESSWAIVRHCLRNPRCSRLIRTPAYILPLWFFFCFRCRISEVTEWISTKLGHIFTYDCYLKNVVPTPPSIYSHRLEGKKTALLTPTLNVVQTYLCNGTWLVAWLSGRTSVFGRRTFSVLRSTCSWRMTTYVGKTSAMGQPTRPTQPFIPSGSTDE